MSDLIDTVIRTRKTSADILVKALVNIDDLSEIEIKEKILTEIKKHEELYPEGYYNPPPNGMAVLLDQKPFERFKYDSLRNPKYWANKTSKLKKETVGMIYFSPVDRKTKMIGDIGVTIYKGIDLEIQKHIKDSYNAILSIAKYTETGMSFSEICSFTVNTLKGKFKFTKWHAINSDPNQTVNLGHTIPGSFENNLIFGNTFEEIKETIRVKRVPLIDTENFKIPETCAFTVESRLEDFNKPYLPSVHFHFIVCFDNGKKTILDNFQEIFQTVGMDYMNK